MNFFEMTGLEELYKVFSRYVRPVCLRTQMFTAQLLMSFSLYLKVTLHPPLPNCRRGRRVIVRRRNRLSSRNWQLWGRG